MSLLKNIHINLIFPVLVTVRVTYIHDSRHTNTTWKPCTTHWEITPQYCHTQAQWCSLKCIPQPIANQSVNITLWMKAVLIGWTVLYKLHSFQCVKRNPTIGENADRLLCYGTLALLYYNIIMRPKDICNICCHWSSNVIGHNFISNALTNRLNACLHNKSKHLLLISIPAFKNYS